VPALDGDTVKDIWTALYLFGCALCILVLAVMAAV
jgi:hypothetical protein